MLWLLIFLSPLANAIVSPTGNNGGGGGFYTGGGGYEPQSRLKIRTSYPKVYRQPPVYSQQAADGSQYGEGQKYRSLEHDARSNEILRNDGGLTSRDSDGIRGGHALTKGNELAEGYSRDVIAANDNQAGLTGSGAAAKYGVAGHGGYGGFGAAQHDNGHSTTGFQKSYHNLQAGKNTKFIDEDHGMANKKFGEVQEGAYDAKGLGAWGQGLVEGTYANRFGQQGGARSAVVAKGAQQSKYGAHDMNGYYHNQDLAYKRGQVLAEENQLARQGLLRARANNEAVVRFPELW